MLNQMLKVKFEDLLIDKLGSGHIALPSKIDWLIPTYMDQDEDRRLLRLQMTKMRRELLFRLAKSQKSERSLPIGWKNCQFVGDKTIEFKFDLRENSLAELETIHVAEVVRFCLVAKKKQLTVLP